MCRWHVNHSTILSHFYTITKCWWIPWQNISNHIHINILWLTSNILKRKDSPPTKNKHTGNTHTHNTYRWWTKSCTTKDDDYPIIYKVLTIPGMVVQDFVHQQSVTKNKWSCFFFRFLHFNRTHPVTVTTSTRVVYSLDKWNLDPDCFFFLY